MTTHVIVQWREKAEPAVIGICRARPASEWHEYASMKIPDARQFIDGVNALKAGRTMFEYRISPASNGKEDSGA